MDDEPKTRKPKTVKAVVVCHNFWWGEVKYLRGDVIEMTAEDAAEYKGRLVVA